MKEKAWNCIGRLTELSSYQALLEDQDFKAPWAQSYFAHGANDQVIKGTSGVRYEKPRQDYGLHPIFN